MRKITEDSVSAFLAHKTFTRGNISTTGGENSPCTETSSLHTEPIMAPWAFGSLSRDGTPQPQKSNWRVFYGWWDTKKTEIYGHTMPILSIWTHKRQTYVGEVNKPNREAMELDGHDWVFVTYPSTAVGMSALTQLLSRGRIFRRWSRNFSLVVPIWELFSKWDYPKLGFLIPKSNPQLTPHLG